MGFVVEDHAILQNFGYRHTLVFRRCDQALFGQIHLHIDRTGEERAFRTDHQFAGVERFFDRTVGRGLGDFTQLRGRRVLTFGQTVDLVVEQDRVEVDVAADRVDEVVAADGQRVAVARGNPNVQTRIRSLHTRSDGVGASVYGVEAEGLHIVNEARRAADARDEREEVVRRIGLVGNFGQGPLYGIQNCVVTAAGTPSYFLVAFEVCRSIFVICHGFISVKSETCS